MLEALQLRTPADTSLHHAVVTHLRHKPDTYINIWEFYKDSDGILFNLLQRMLDAGEITADNLRDGLITDQSMIYLKIQQARELA